MPAKTVIPRSVHSTDDPRIAMERLGCDDPDEVAGARVYNDVETCRACGGTTKVIACIEDRVVIEKILAHLQGKDTLVPTNLLPASRAPPADLFDGHHPTLHPSPMAMT